MIKEFELIPHTADLKIQAYGITLEELFKNALKSMFTIIKPKSKYIKYINNNIIINTYTAKRHVTVESQDSETLIIDFLSECLYLSDIYNESYFNANFSLINSNKLEANIFGIKSTGFDVEIKAVTYHDLTIKKINKLYVATIVFDI